MDVEGLVRYVYRGEVDVQPEQLQSFLRTAELLQIKGLADQGLGNNPGEVENVSTLENADVSATQLSPHQHEQKSATTHIAVSAAHLPPRVLSSPNFPFQQQRCSSAQSPTPAPSAPIGVKSCHSVISASSVGNEKVISPTTQPCIKVPVPPTPHLSSLKRSNFTNLAQYLSGSTNSMVTSPSASLSPPHGETHSAPNTAGNIGNGGGSVSKRRKVYIKENWYFPKSRMCIYCLYYTRIENC